MKEIKHIAAVFSLLIVFVWLCGGQAIAQNSFSDNVTDQVKTAMRTGSSKELARHFDNKVRISFVDEKPTDYSNTQAEFVMKNFFSKHPATDFSYGFDGDSNTKSKSYVIGTYTHEDGTFTVLIRLKESSGRYLVHSIEFIK
ncbi:DUF4783 domain-containing protein [Pontibacter harenae]|uniref:DUF4783 domain-containing protein n=1 Tax=Pontibacter harenae TaxID=2894083 RepID=UPI001E4A7281|nr:DUF4783 domain-containing protein [Pontibacter harenae]MCC9165442.1 DUF4783 domain-containing protein [Pontibacter harenae]